MVFLYGIVLTLRAKVNLKKYDIIDEVSCKVEVKQFAQCKKITC